MIRAAGPILVGGWLIDIMTGTYLGRQDRSYAGQMIICTTTTRYRMHFVWYGARVCSVSLLSARVCNTFTLGIWIIPTSRYSSRGSSSSLHAMTISRPTETPSETREASGTRQRSRAIVLFKFKRHQRAPPSSSLPSIRWIFCYIGGRF